MYTYLLASEYCSCSYLIVNANAISKCTFFELLVRVIFYVRELNVYSVILIAEILCKWRDSV